MEKKSFFIVSQDGSPVRRIRFTFFTVVLPALFLAFGAAAYFIPADIFRLQAAEIRRKKELREQNNELHHRFLATLKVLNRAREQIDGIEAKKKGVTELTGNGASNAVPARRDAPAGRPAPEYAAVKPSALYAILCVRDSVVSAFSDRAAHGRNPFESLPVLRPVGTDAVISRGFGRSMDPFTGLEKQHNGLDLAAPAGTPVLAAASGCIARVEASEMWGKRIVLEHGGGFSTVYAHLGSVCAGRGRTVKRGAVIGYVGVSGLSSGPHVHYEVWKNGTALDPQELFFPARMH